LHASGLNDQQSLPCWTRGLNSQAYLLASIDFFWISASCLAIIALVWFRGPHRRRRSVAVAE